MDTTKTQSAAETKSKPGLSPAFLAKMKRGYVNTPWIDLQVQAAYATGPARGEVRRVAARLGWPAWAVKRRARELALTRTQEQGWTQQELLLLESNAHRSPEQIQRALARAGFARTLSAICLQIKRGHYKDASGTYTAASLAAAFRVDPAVVRGWIAKGWLNATTKGTRRVEGQGGDIWQIEEDDVRRFVVKYPLVFNIARVDQLWFMNMVTEGRLCA